MFKAQQINHQLPLNISLNEEAIFAEFCWQGNELLKTQLFTILTGNSDKHLHIWGEPGCGKSHVLQACCQFVAETNNSAVYLPLNLLKDSGPEILDGFDCNFLVCLDDVDSIANNKAWEEALFHLYNRIKDNNNHILITTSKKTPQNNTIALPDLRSRLAAGLVLNLKDLDDDTKVTALQTLASKRGFSLSTTVCHYLLTRYTRNMHDLHNLLNLLDRASLIAQRKITIPFIRKTLEGHCF